MSFLDVLKTMTESPEGQASALEFAAKRKAALASALERYGSPEAVMATTPTETALIDACRPYVEAGRLDAHFPPNPDDMDPDVVQAIKGAIPFPTTVAGLMAEYRLWDTLMSDRAAVDNNVSPPVAVGCRERLLEAALDTVPASDFADIEARLEWMQTVIDLGFTRDARCDENCLDALKGDIARLRSRTIPLP